MKIDFSRQAAATLNAIARDLLALYGRDLGRFHLLEITTTVQKLSANPQSGRFIMADENGLDIFITSSGPFEILYQIYKSHIYILDIIRAEETPHL